MSTALVYFKTCGLRTEDNEPFFRAHSENACIIHLFCFDERLFQNLSRFGRKRLGHHRHKFILESVQDLATTLSRAGSRLLVQQGKPEEIVPAVVRALGVQKVYTFQEICSEERTVDEKIQASLPDECEFLQFWGNALYDVQDLPFTIENLPLVFTHFRKQIEQAQLLCEPLPVPEIIKPFPEYDKSWETVLNLDMHPAEPPVFPESTRRTFAFKGGEAAGNARMQDYFFETKCLRNYKETRDGMLGANFSSKLSPWIAHGCVSVRSVLQKVKQFEELHGSNESTYWFYFELLVREFFRLQSLKFGDAIFKLGGLQNNAAMQEWKVDYNLYEAWCEGRTGYPIVDANMRELLETGYMSNRGRQIVASFLTKDLELDWRMGAEYFEELLIDYDTCSNYMNWAYVAGVGCDPRGSRYFNLAKQALLYDSQAEFMKHWCPELLAIPKEALFQPQTLISILNKSDLSAGHETYPPVIVQTKHSDIGTVKKKKVRSSRPQLT